MSKHAAISLHRGAHPVCQSMPRELIVYKQMHTSYVKTNIDEWRLESIPNANTIIRKEIIFAIIRIYIQRNRTDNNRWLAMSEPSKNPILSSKLIPWERYKLIEINCRWSYAWPAVCSCEYSSLMHECLNLLTAWAADGQASEVNTQIFGHNNIYTWSW